MGGGFFLVSCWEIEGGGVCLANLGQLAGKLILIFFCSFLVLYLMIPCLQMNK